MRLREDRVRRRDGSAGIFGVVEKRDFALVIPLDGGQVHMVEQFRYPVGGRYWEFPQGTSPEAHGAEDLARLELRQETGMSAGSLRHIGRLFEDYAYSTQAFDVFVATDLTPGEPDPEPEEQDMRRARFPLERLEAMISRGEIADAASVAAYGLLLLDRGRRLA